MISITKKLFLTILLIFLAVSFAYAEAINGYSDAVLSLLPRSLTYNKADAIELTTPKALTTSDVGSLAFSSKISDDPSKNLGIVRFQDTLHNMYTKLQTWRGYKKSNYNNVRDLDVNEMFKIENYVILRIYTTGIFVKEDDPNVVRDFSLSCFVTEANITETGSEYTKISGFPKKVTESDMTLSDTVSKTYFKDLGGGNYELYIPSTPIISASTETRYYPLLLRVFDLCIELSGDATGLPTGYYKTDIVIQSVDPYKNRSFTGERTQTTTGYTIETNVVSVSMSETITVWGYVGEVSSEDETAFSFSVSPSSDTFSMDLSRQDYYSVASLNFHSLIGPYQSNTAPASNRNEKFKVYISPGPDYLTPGTYCFTKTNGSETIPYDIYLDSNGASFSSNYTTGMGGSGKGVANIPSSSYYIIPNYNLVTDNFYNQQQVQYTETWSLSSVPLFLKVEQDNVQHTPGEYKSNLYFTIVVD